MASPDKTLTPELVRILKIFLFGSLGLVFIFSFFNSYRANNSQKDRTFYVSDANRLYFLNVRGVFYDRELRRDAGMTLFRFSNRFISEETPTLDPVIVLNPIKEEAYLIWEINNADFPIQVLASKNNQIKELNFSGGNNIDHWDFFKQISPLILDDFNFELNVDGQNTEIWTGDKEREALKTITEDYLKLLNKTN